MKRKPHTNYSRDVLLASYIGDVSALYIKPTRWQRLKRWIKSF